MLLKTSPPASCENDPLCSRITGTPNANSCASSPWNWRRWSRPPRVWLLHFGLRLPRALALLRFSDLLAGHLCSDIGHCAGDVAARSARRQGKKCELQPLQSFDVVLRDAVACGVEKSKVELREYHALVGRAP